MTVNKGWQLPTNYLLSCAVSETNVRFKTRQRHLIRNDNETQPQNSVSFIINHNNFICPSFQIITF